MAALGEKAQQAQIQELICYLWDNYIQLIDADDLFIMGVGNASIGVKALLVNRGTLNPQIHPFTPSLSTLLTVANHQPPITRLQVPHLGYRELRNGLPPSCEERRGPGALVVVQGPLARVRGI